MAGRLKRWWRERIIRRAPWDSGVWDGTLKALPLLAGLDAAELERLRSAVILFLHDKSIHGAAGLELDAAMRLTIAAQACILILNLDVDYYSGWSEVIVYPDEFMPTVEYTDENGVVHTGREVRVGEAWLHGPVILSWADVAPTGDGVNVVIHEFAHKLDMLNGDANGFPPLHAGMSRRAWSQAFGEAYDDFCRRADVEEDLAIDPYAAESPGEFFAVISEAFFETPRAVHGMYPAVYEQLRAFYRQDPAMRLPAPNCPAR